MYKTPAQELIRRTKQICSELAVEHQGNGYYHREYEIGEISLCIDGQFKGNEPIDQGIFIELGEVEILSVDFNKDGTNDLVRINVDLSVVERVLEVVRKHMVLEDLADV